jgi:AAA+ ATPase superfamily predicted ATPase
LQTRNFATRNFVTHGFVKLEDVIDRRQELERLRVAAAEAPQLVVMRGRRRVGKSYLLDRSFAEYRLVYFQADEGEMRGHLDLLANELGRLINAPVAFRDWNEALTSLGDQALDEPLVVVLDEFQWMLMAEPLLDSIIMRHFDKWERARVPITLVLSGSALTMMEQLLDGGRPMFGRAGYRPLVQPFDYRDAALFASTTANSTHKLQRYGILGGTAQYQVWAGKASIREILKRRILAKDESLFEEPLQLIRGESTIREPGNYYELLRTIARGATRFSDIAQRSKISSGQLLNNRLERLASLHYIEERRPLGGNGSASWSISDPFFRFWFRYIYPNRSRLQRGRVEEVCDAIMADFDNYMGPVFEDVCRDWAARHSTDQKLADAEEIGSYWTRTHDVEVDLVARRRSGVIVVGSCKWSARADAHDLDRLIELRGKIRGAGNAALYVFARDFHKSLIDRAALDDVRLVSADELFAES